MDEKCETLSLYVKDSHMKLVLINVHRSKQVHHFPARMDLFAFEVLVIHFFREISKTEIQMVSSEKSTNSEILTFGGVLWMENCTAHVGKQFLEVTFKSWVQGPKQEHRNDQSWDRLVRKVRLGDPTGCMSPLYQFHNMVINLVI